MEPAFSNQKIGIIGLGLMGGSFAKALTQYTKAKVYGYDLDEEVMERARQEGVITSTLAYLGLRDMDLLLLCLPPQQTVDFLTKYKKGIPTSCTVVDICGVKGWVMDQVRAMGPLGFLFVGAHPMAGKEAGGYENSEVDLFQGASMIMTPLANTPQPRLQSLEGLWASIGFGRTVCTSETKHDRVVALTSQLCHLVSNAYVQSPTALCFDGFSAGSFADLTRVAKLDPALWTELFLCNRQALLVETQTLINRLQQYQQALMQEDEEGLFALLDKGNRMKSQLMEEEKKERIL